MNISEQSKYYLLRNVRTKSGQTVVLLAWHEKTKAYLFYTDD